MRYPIDVYIKSCGKDIYLPTCLGIKKYCIERVCIAIESGITKIKLVSKNINLDEKDIIAFSKDDLIKQLLDEVPVYGI